MALTKGQKLRVKLILNKGAKCCHCKLKYNGKNAAGFDFHHRDPEDKEFTIAYGIKKKSRKEVIKEAKKCDLLCKVCHVVLHAVEY